MRESSGTDDQQATKALQIGWLAGVVDGEGALTIHRNREARGWRVRPGLTIESVDPVLIETAAAILKESGVGPYIWRRKAARAKNRQKTVILHVTGWCRMAKLLTLLLPYLVNKREEATEMGRLVFDRAARPRGPNGGNHTGLPAWDALAGEVFENMKRIKATRSLRDCTPISLRWRGMKIQSELLGD